jgi:hypothetical protein
MDSVVGRIVWAWGWIASRTDDESAASGIRWATVENMWLGRKGKTLKAPC